MGGFFKTTTASRSLTPGPNGQKLAGLFPASPDVRPPNTMPDRPAPGTAYITGTGGNVTPGVSGDGGGSDTTRPTPGPRPPGRNPGGPGAGGPPGGREGGVGGNEGPEGPRLGNGAQRGPDASTTVGGPPAPPVTYGAGEAARGAALRARRKGAGSSVLTELVKGTTKPAKAVTNQRTLLGY